MSRKRRHQQVSTKERQHTLPNQPVFPDGGGRGKTELLVNEVLKNPQVLEKIARRPEGVGMMMQIQTKTRSGPIPEAEELAKYEGIYPGLAKEIVGMAKDSQAYRQEQGRKSLSGEIWRDRLAQILAFGTVIIVSLVACYLISKEAYGSATTLLCTVLASGVGVFFMGRNEKTSNAEESKGPAKK